MSFRRDPAKTSATYEDVLAAPEHLVAEILDGELVLSPRPAPRHALAGSVIGSDLGSRFHGPSGGGGSGGWWILFEPELHFGEDILVPYQAGWLRTRLPKIPDDAFFTLAPDWICEVLSPSTARRDRVQKLARYAREKISHAWLVDPIARTVEVLGLEGERWVLLGNHGGDEKVRLAPFQAVELELSRWWGD